MRYDTRSNIVNFLDVEVNKDPYHYIKIDQFFDNKKSLELLNWLENTSVFVSESSDFYDQSMFPVSMAILPEHLKDLLSEESLTTVKRAAEEAFEVIFNDNVIVTAHRLLPGQRTMIHNDYLVNPHDIKYGFTHRIVVYLNKEWDPTFGGELGIYSSDKTEDLVTNIAPIHNTAVGFTFGKSSYHDISEVLESKRYTLNFTFLSKK